MASEATVRRMTALVRQWESSAESKTDFVRRHGVALSTFGYWQRRVRAAPPLEAGPTFAAVHLVAEPDGGHAGRVKVVLPSGERLLVPVGTPVDLLRTIMVALRSGC